MESLCCGALQSAPKVSPQCTVHIAEGYTFGDSPTFTRHLGIVYGSAVEAGELLRLAAEAGVIEENVMKPLLQGTQEAEHILLALLKRCRKVKS